MKSSVGSIWTKGVAGCYCILIGGEYGNHPFCYLYHFDQSIGPIDADTTLSDTLLELLNYLGNLIKTTFPQALQYDEEITFDKMSNLSLFIGGGIQQDPDYIRLSFGLLQNEFSSELLQIFERYPDERYLLDNFHIIKRP